MKCPICKADVDERERGREGSSYPFCSPRCKLIDLGRWLDGRYQIPVDSVEEGDFEADVPPPPPGDRPGRKTS